MLGGIQSGFGCVHRCHKAIQSCLGDWFPGVKSGYRCDCGSIFKSLNCFLGRELKVSSIWQRIAPCGRSATSCVFQSPKSVELSNSSRDTSVDRGDVTFVCRDQIPVACESCLMACPIASRRHDRCRSTEVVVCISNAH